MKLIFPILLLVSASHAQFHNYILNTVDTPPPVDPSSLVHREVVVNAQLESQYPSELLNPFYKNPRIAAGLAKESWLANKEFPVFHRDTQDISRSAILKIFKNANYFQKRR